MYLLFAVGIPFVKDHDGEMGREAGNLAGQPRNHARFPAVFAYVCQYQQGRAVTHL